ncbi:MAG: isoprenyl transferase [Gammaproteobacteria bacterium]|nr:isoprenyl transferase [Gammaproteobacteria bacterium]
MGTISKRSLVVPRHVAIIMDGNGRWARAKHLPRTAGHQQGVKATRRIVEHCAGRGVEVLTLFAFSSENWKRPQTEVQTLMELFLITLRSEAERLLKNGISLRFIGERMAFSDKLQREIQAAEQTTASATGMVLNVAANYGGRWDITQALRRLVGEVVKGSLRAEEITADVIADRLSTAKLIEPDLFIRTGGETRISNFLLWQMAYTELYFTDILWPNFNEETLELAFESFANRQRRFGKTGEQVNTERKRMPDA